MKTRSGVRASQKVEELNRLKEIIRETSCATYLEIGARDGDTFWEIVRTLPKGSKVVAVDLPGGEWGATRSQKNLQECGDLLRKLGYDVTIIFGDSTDTKIINQINKFGRFDAVLIDGDHRYEGVKKDWINYSGFAAKIVAFHDIDGLGVRQKSTGALVEVPILWNEIKSSFKFEEIISKEEPNRPMGIGVLFMDSSL